MGVVRVPVICGPTAAGKSALAMALAETSGAVVVSADARQIYRGFDIGTAKPSLDERRRVRHEGIDVIGPDERYSAARWVRAASDWIAAAQAEHRPVLVVGGTGLYLKALFEPFFEEPPLDPDRRAALAAILDSETTEDLRRWCVRLDPARAHLGRTQLLRAIEIAMLSGHRISDLHRTASRRPLRAARYLHVDAGESLAARIEGRTDDMLRSGWEDEVRSLVECVEPDVPAWNATGYRSIREVVTGELTLDVARTRVIIDTRQYAKRQRTWFRHQLRPDDVVHLDATTRDAQKQAFAWWRTGESM